jgi:(1->4)-alpha-D-glucan 1-alpha-D-glucosylmutase
VKPEPVATYRLQLRPDFGFDQAAALVPGLAALGVSHLYLSPVLQAAEGSLHGYDMTDPRRLNVELGGRPAFDRLHQALYAHGMGLMLDLVPNHMSIAGRQNPWWWDLLKHGPGSRHARYFDVDWEANEARWPHQLLLPVLSDHYGRVLEAGRMKVRRSGGEYVVEAEGEVFPLDPKRLGTALPALADDARIAALNMDVEALHQLLQQQHYRLALWRAGDRDLGYRRFFDVKELAGLRMEDPEVFNAVHSLVVDLVRQGQVQALRVDHPDGLREPAAYFRRLRQACPGAWIVAEKILQADEELPADWPVDGSTGYDHLALADGLLLDPAGQAPLTDFFAAFTGQAEPWEQLKLRSRRDALAGLLASELNLLSQRFVQVCERHRRHRDYSQAELRHALLESAAHFPAYRSYASVNGELPELSAQDRGRIEQALRQAAAARPDLDPELFRFFESLLLLKWPRGPELDLALRFQQFCAAAMAKGVEDTAFYRYFPLASLGEVGADPGRFGTDPAAFHEACRRAQKKKPLSLLADSTHDTKRSGDCRARLALLSERPRAWIEAVKAWSAHNERHRTGDWPDRAMEYLLYQNLVAAWPVEAPRLEAAMLKSAHEAKQQTSWKKPDQAYEEALKSFVQGALADSDFMEMVEAYVRPLLGPGRINALSLTLLKLCAPGVPDIYQGTEAWRLSLVDPDNRRPVDFEGLARAMARLPAPDGDAPFAQGLDLGRDEEGLAKLWLLRQGLALRRRRAECFGPVGSYEALALEGPEDLSALAFIRGGRCVAVAPRLTLGLEQGWRGTMVALPKGRWRNCLDGARNLEGPQPLERLLLHFPVALLEPEGSWP